MKRPNLPLKDRLEIVKEYIKPESVVRTDTIHSEKNVYDKHKHYTGIGYEGVMIRNIDSPYTLKHRSKNLQKYKTFLDDEYPVIDFKEGTGKDKGTIIFIMKSHTGKIFNCRPRGTAEARAKAYKNGKSYIGKKITVTYQELTAGGTPVFPVCTLTPRDYE